MLTDKQVEDGFSYEPEYEYSNPTDTGYVQRNRRAFREWKAKVEREAAAQARGEALIEVVQAHRNLHQTYGSTAVCRGGIGGQVLTSHCAEICYNADAHETEMQAWQALEVEAIEYSRARAAEYRKAVEPE